MSLGFNERKLESSVDISVAHKRADKLLDRFAVDPKKFINVFLPEVIERDTSRVERILAQIDSNDKSRPKEFKELNKLSKVAEAIIFEGIESEEWLSAHVRAIPASKYDDLINGADLILEFNRGERGDSNDSALVFSVDVVTGSDPKVIRDKFARAREEIESGELATLEYFQSPIDDKKRGTLEKIPRVILGFSRGLVKETMDLWLNKKHKELSESPAHRLILEELRMELEAFRDYALAKGKDGANTAKVYDAVIEAIYEALEEKGLSPKKPFLTEQEQEDETFALIAQEVDNMRSDNAGVGADVAGEDIVN